MYTIRPCEYKQFGQPSGDIAFQLVTDPAYRDAFVFDEQAESAYGECLVDVFASDESLASLLQRRRPNCKRRHVLVIAPNRFISSPNPAELSDCKLVVVPCSSTPTGDDTIGQLLAAMERTDVHAQESSANRILELFGESPELVIRDDATDTKAVFEHHAGDNEWIQQAGMLDWGEQQIGPAGDVSVLPMDINRFDANRRLKVTGELTLRGVPVVHSGHPSYDPRDQQRIFDRLSQLHGHGVIVSLEDGLVTDVRAVQPDAQAAVDILQSLFEVDSRYRSLWEVGVGLNTSLDLLPGNVGMNEVHGGSSGVLHVGFGLTPYTQYALIFVCSGSRILTADGSVILGQEELAVPATRVGKMKRNKSAGCVCHW